MNNPTRRGFLTVVGIGAAAAGAGVLAPSAASASPVEAPGAATPAALPASASGSLAAYVHDVRKGEVAVMVDGHEVVVHDHALVATLAKAAAQRA